MTARSRDDHGPAIHIEIGEPTDAGRRVLQCSWPTRPDVREGILAEIGRTLTIPGWVSDQDHSWLRLCLDEALANAMYHGNEGDPRLSVEVAVFINAERWTVHIADQGVGFSAAVVPGHQRPEDLEREHGRGIRLMLEWLDQLTYWRGGRLIALSRQRADGTI